MNKCQHFDPELNICKLHSDWSSPMPVLTPCVESPCEDYSPKPKMAKEYIEREWLLNRIKPLCEEDYHNATLIATTKELMRNHIMSAPAADVVEVVRCKDCKYFGKNKAHRVTKLPLSFCDKFMHNITTDNDFCSYGERKGTENG